MWGWMETEVRVGKEVGKRSGGWGWAEVGGWMGGRMCRRMDGWMAG